MMFGQGWNREPPVDPAEQELQAEKLAQQRLEKTYRWRLQIFILAVEGAGGGISTENVDALDELARSTVDSHEIVKALVRGCPLELAVKIFL